MECEVLKGGGRVNIMLPNVFTFDCRDGLRQAMLESTAGTMYELDFRKVERMDSSALGMLLLLRSNSKGESLVVLKNVRPQILKILQIANFQKLFQIDIAADST